MSIILVKRQIEAISVDKAKHYLTFNTYPFQRGVRPAHVQSLAEKMKAGIFRTGEVLFASKYDEREVLLNGQHQLNAALDTGSRIDAVVEHWCCDTAEEVAKLFRQCENLPRAINDYITAEKAALNLDWPNYVAQVVVAAAAINFFDYGSFRGGKGVGSSNNVKKTLSKDQRVELLKNYANEIGDFVCKILTKNGAIKSKRPVAHIARAAVVYLMMETYKVSPTDALIFWERVRDGEFLTREMPEMIYRDFLIMAMPSRETRYQAPSNKEYISRGSLAWNYFREGKTVKQIKYYFQRPAPELK